MGAVAALGAVRENLEPTRADLERRLREAYAEPWVENSELYDHVVYLGGWPFYVHVLARSDFGQIDAYGSSYSPLLWAVRGRHRVVTDEDLLYLSTPEDVRAIHEHIESLPPGVLAALFGLRSESIAQENEPRRHDLKREQALAGGSEANQPAPLWAEVAAFYRRAAAEGRYVTGEIG